jgi:hypothetical protein
VDDVVAGFDAPLEDNERWVDDVVAGFDAPLEDVWV